MTSKALPTTLLAVADFRQNPYTLVYDGAITQNEPGKVQIHPVANQLMSQDALPKATGTQDKELFMIEGATHVETYWVPKVVDDAIAKLKGFYARTL